MRFRKLFFEPDPDGGEPLTGDLSPATPEQLPIEPAASEWAGPSQEEWQRTQEYLQQQAQVINDMYGRLPEPPRVPEPQVPDLDPFDPQSVRNFIDQQIQDGIRQSLQPYEPVMGMVAQQQGQEIAKETLSSLKGDVGQFDDEAALLIGASLLDGSIDPQQALRQAAEWARDFEARIRADERAQINGTLQNLGNAPAESPGRQTTAVEVPQVPTGPRKYHEVVERVLAESSPVYPAG